VSDYNKNLYTCSNCYAQACSYKCEMKNIQEEIKENDGRGEFKYDVYDIL
jgi:hypothetical protein